MLTALDRPVLEKFLTIAPKEAPLFGLWQNQYLFVGQEMNHTRLYTAETFHIKAIVVLGSCCLKHQPEYWWEKTSTHINTDLLILVGAIFLENVDITPKAILKFKNIEDYQNAVRLALEEKRPLV